MEPGGHAYARCCAESTAIDPTELQWGHDVLSEYFAANDGQPEIQELKDTFFRAGSTCAVAEGNGERMIPYRRTLTAPPPDTIEALADLAQRRRSVRWFLQKPVDRAVIDRALEVAAQAPSACNRQPFEFRIFDEPELVQKVVNIPFGLAGYGHNVPVAVVVVGKQRHYFDERDRHLIYIDASLAVMGFLYALEASGLASCCVNWPDIEGKEERMAELLALEPDERPVMLVVLGHPDPDGKVARSTKKNLSQLRRYNFE
ncbi:MAG: nitroreductase family protein [Gemmatimonadota bacterium]